MLPPLFPLVSANAAVAAIFGADPCRVYPFGEAPTDVATPYAVWAVLDGDPQNTLADRVDMDALSIQLDVYAATGTDSDLGLDALRAVLEEHCIVSRLTGAERQEDPALYRASLDLDWFLER